MKTLTKNPLMAAIGCLMLAGGSAAAEEASLSPYTTHVYPDTLLIEPIGDKAFDASVEITIKGPGDMIVQQKHPAGSLIELDPSSLPDGAYNFEVRAAGSDKVRSRAETGAAAPVSVFEAHSGVFTIENGEFVSPEVVEPPSSAYSTKKSSSASTQAADTGGSELLAQVFPEDLIVQGSTCIGFDCATSESFGFDTIRLKENNLRIKFDDTSTSGSFPSNDWQLTANDSANGGANKFSIDDVTGGKTPFTVEAGARNNALYVDDGGRVGFGTSAPVVRMHSVDGNTPTLRLEQDGSSGFTPQTWDVAGNEANFFVRDATNGSKLPFRIRPNAPQSSIDIAANGNVGMGTQSPSQPLHISRSNNSAQVLVEDTGSGLQTMFSLVNNGYPLFTMEDTSQSNVNWAFRLSGSERSTERFEITKLGTGAAEFELFHDGSAKFRGDVTANGVLLTSARATKTDFEPVDTREILEKLASLEITEWRYRKEEEGTRHIGAVAEEFQEIFGLSDGKTLNMIDTTGISFAAIKALKQQVDEKEAEVQALNVKVDRLEKAVEVLMSQVEVK